MKGSVLLFAVSTVAMPAFADTAAVADAHSEAFAKAMNARGVESALASYTDSTLSPFPSVDPPEVRHA